VERFVHVDAALHSDPPRPQDPRLRESDDDVVGRSVSAWLVRSSPRCRPCSRPQRRLVRCRWLSPIALHGAASDLRIDLLESIERSGLRGRFGADFPPRGSCVGRNRQSLRRWSSPLGGGGGVVQTEPASAKDHCCLSRAAASVSSGAVLAAPRDRTPPCSSSRGITPPVLGRCVEVALACAMTRVQVDAMVETPVISSPAMGERRGCRWPLSLKGAARAARPSSWPPASRFERWVLSVARR